MSMAAAETVVLLQPDSALEGTDVAVVWIQGADYEAGQYTDIASAFQLEAAAAGYRAWVGIPDFTYSKTKHTSVDKHIESVVEKINSSGFTGDNWFLAAHSLGGILT